MMDISTEELLETLGMVLVGINDPDAVIFRGTPLSRGMASRVISQAMDAVEELEKLQKSQ